MNILKPQKILFEKLKNIQNLMEEIRYTEEIENIKLENYREENIEINDISIEKSMINNTNIINSNLEKNTFVDVEFKNCNFLIVNRKRYVIIYMICHARPGKHKRFS